MKKLLSVLVIVALCATIAVGLVGCVPQDKAHADVFFYTYDDAYISTVRKAMEDRLTGLGMDYTFYNGEGKQDIQTNQIDTALSKGTNLLVINIVDTGATEAVKGIVAKAEKSNVPVVFFNREPADEVFTSSEWAKKNVAFVGTDYKEAGYLEGQAIAENLLKSENIVSGKSKFDRNSDNSIKYIMLRGEMNNNEARARTIYSVLTANYLLNKAGVSFRLSPSSSNVTESTPIASPADWKFEYDGMSVALNAVPGTMATFNPYNSYLVDAESKWSAANAKKMLETALTAENIANGTNELIIANNDDMAVGAVTALEAVGYNKEDATKYVPVFGVDATAGALDLIKNKKMTATVLQSNTAMANTVITIIGNVVGKGKLMDGTFMFNVDSTVNKIRIPYDIVA